MKRFNNPAICLILAILLLVTACKKSSSMLTVKLTGADSSKTVNVVKGEKISITLGNPGDGGYNFDNWQYNTAALQLISHMHTNPPANTNLAGNFGTDTWRFNVIANGTSTLKLTASRTAADVITLFNGVVNVQ